MQQLVIKFNVIRTKPICLWRRFNNFNKLREKLLLISKEEAYIMINGGINVLSLNHVDVRIEMSFF